MPSIFCPECRLSQPTEHTYCIACGTDLPTQLLEPRPGVKSARLFPGIKVSEGDPEGAFLRVSCYLKEQIFRSKEGSVTIPGRHVRFSVWVADEARCVMSIPESEARSLAAFISSELGRPDSELAHNATAHPMR